METEFKITLGITNYQLTKAKLASAIGAKTSTFRFLHILEKLQSPGKNKPDFRNPLVSYPRSSKRCQFLQIFKKVGSPHLSHFFILG